MLRVALLTVDRPALGGLERDFALLSAVAADRLMHLAWATVEASSITQLFHSYSVGILQASRGSSYPHQYTVDALLNLSTVDGTGNL